PRRDDFELVTRLMLENKLIDKPIAFEEYVDPRFAEGAAHETAWDYPVGAGRLDPEMADD
ncbi:MAG TPA: hypothetical protein VF664_02905, partial [Cystobacter sp.]